MSLIVPESIENLSPYVPGRLLEDVQRELNLSNIIKLASNENSLGASPRAMDAMTAALGNIYRYGDADARALKLALSEKFGYDPACIVAGNGSSEFILVLAHALCGPGLSAVMSRPSFTLYAKNVEAAGGRALEAPLTPAYGHDLDGLLKLVDETTRLVFLDNPLNPTGAYLQPDEIAAFYEKLPDTCLLVLDEAYVEFARQPKLLWSPSLERLAVMRTFSKLYGLAGLRAAYCLMAPQFAAAINKVRQPFNMNSLTQAGAIAALGDEDFIQRTLRMTWDGLDYLRAECVALGLKPYPTEANFIMIGLDGRSADEVFQAILRQGIISRSLSSFGLTQHLRVNAGQPYEMEAFIRALKAVL